MPSSRGSRSRSPIAAAGTAPSERSPLLGPGRQDEGPLLGDGVHDERFPESDESAASSRRRWPSIVALMLLCLSCMVILAVGFFAPAVGERYAREAVTFEYRNATLVALESDGAAIRVVGDVRVDAKRVQSNTVRNFGRIATWFVRKVSVGAAKVEVFALDWHHDSDLLGTVLTPPMEVGIGNGVVTTVDVVMRARPGSLELIKALVAAYFKADLWRLRVEGRTEVDLHAGLIPLGVQPLREQITFEGIPSTPSTNVLGLNLTETALPEGGKAIQVEVLAEVLNTTPFAFSVPKLDFEVFLPACGDGLARVAEATTDSLKVEPKQQIQASIGGLIRQLPEEFVTSCPGTEYSPLDNFLGKYMHGRKTIIYVKGGKQTHSDVPAWLGDLLKTVTVPVPFPGHEFGDLIKSFALSEVDFELPDPTAEPDSPDAMPKLSAAIEAVVAVPKELNFPVDVKHIRAFANITHAGAKFGELHVKKWVDASSKLQQDGDLLIESRIDHVPIMITDYDIFQKVVQKMLWGGGVKLGIEGKTDVEIVSGLGLVVVRDVPASGTIDIDGFPNIATLGPRATRLGVLDTTKSSLKLSIDVEVNNPTIYSATVPYANVHLSYGGHLLGNGTVNNLRLGKGKNTFNVVAMWEQDSEDARVAGRKLLGKYISGKNVTLGINPHPLTLPSLPTLSKSLSKISLGLPAPRLAPPSGKNETHFLDSAVLHLLTSSATFTIYTPLSTAIKLYTLNGTASYNDSILGTIVKEDPLSIPAGPALYETERIPVRWESGVGWDAAKRALGGTLKVHAVADAEVGIGKWRGGTIRYEGKGIGARVRI